MESGRLREIIEVKKKLNDRENLLYSIIRGTGPVLEGLKPGVLLNFSDNYRCMKGAWEEYRDSLEKELLMKYTIINENRSRSLIFFYDEELLEKRLLSEENSLLLQKFGYRNCMDSKDCLLKLKERFREGCPHEVGLFLGIPLLDVIGFLENKGKNYLFCGYWKVYHKPEEARQTFRDYDEAIIRALNKKFPVVL